jgi:hypothetical protein
LAQGLYAPIAICKTTIGDITMKIHNTSNCNAPDYIEKLEQFQGSNFYSRWVNGAYVIYSHRDTYPIFVFCNKQWYGHSERFSQSTSRHQYIARPKEYQVLSFDQMRLLALRGYNYLVRDRMGVGHGV